MEQFSDQGGAKSTTRTFSFRLGGLHLGKKVRSLILLGFGQDYYVRLSFSGQQYKQIVHSARFGIKTRKKTKYKETR